MSVGEGPHFIRNYHRNLIPKPPRKCDNGSPQHQQGTTLAQTHVALKASNVQTETPPNPSSVLQAQRPSEKNLERTPGNLGGLLIFEVRLVSFKKVGPSLENDVLLQRLFDGRSLHPKLNGLLRFDATLVVQRNQQGITRLKILQASRRSSPPSPSLISFGRRKWGVWPPGR